MQFHSPRGQITGGHWKFFVSFLCIHCSRGRYLFARRISAIYCIFSLSILEWLGSSHIWSSASRNEILCSLNQFNQNFLFATNILKFLNLSKADGDRSFSPIWHFHSLLYWQYKISVISNFYTDMTLSGVHKWLIIHDYYALFIPLHEKFAYLLYKPWFF